MSAASGAASRSAREGQALRWLRPRDLRELPMPPADRPLIPVLEELL